MSASTYTTTRIFEKRRRNKNTSIDSRLHCQPQNQFSWNSGSSISSTSAPESKGSVSNYDHLKQSNLRSTMSLINYSSADEDEDYPSSDNDHLFMKDSPRRQSSSSASPPSSNNDVQSTQPLRAGTLSRSTPICICRNPSYINFAASLAAAFSPVSPAIWNELHRLFPCISNPQTHFNILRRSTPITDGQGKAFVLVEARVQAKDGSMVAKGEMCTDHVLALRSLRNALMETKGERRLPMQKGEEIIAGRIGVFEGVCSACGLSRF
ncbi:uncharacterized protein M437DRAFT_56352 [Aureobasidium melanogenum CBS 110374]|uniref:Uncharacterized protein n=1 Tax=Aureobasidium melanogenum (strain CBS 110374) TaxID=1043003 RepID=A0A074WAL1_AURM1|nr:uncharacterized protein M437DRAFT_56352 [Aureobasidium melanogenum CBS 110374]KEQ59556.1 hypothetical protein M437DRAFT_56352 [Aureobasidium melanogenum CBS 110374]